MNQDGKFIIPFLLFIFTAIPLWAGTTHKSKPAKTSKANAAVLFKSVNGAPVPHCVIGGKRFKQVKPRFMIPTKPIFEKQNGLKPCSSKETNLLAQKRDQIHRNKAAGPKTVGATCMLGFTSGAANGKSRAEWGMDAGVATDTNLLETLSGGIFTTSFVPKSSGPKGLNRPIYVGGLVGILYPACDVAGFLVGFYYLKTEPQPPRQIEEVELRDPYDNLVNP